MQRLCAASTREIGMRYVAWCAALIIGTVGALELNETITLVGESEHVTVAFPDTSIADPEVYEGWLTHSYSTKSRIFSQCEYEFCYLSDPTEYRESGLYDRIRESIEEFGAPSWLTVEAVIKSESMSTSSLFPHLASYKLNDSTITGKIVVRDGLFDTEAVTVILTPENAYWLSVTGSSTQSELDAFFNSFVVTPREKRPSEDSL